MRWQTAAEIAAAEAAEAQAAADRQVQDAHKRQVQDLKDKGDASAPTGQEEYPTGPSVGPDARKDIYAKARARRKAAEEADMAADPGLKQIHDDITEVTGHEPGADVVPSAEPIQQEPEPGQGVAPSSREDYTDPDALVEVTIHGDRRLIPERDIQAAGGVGQYQIAVAAEETWSRAAEERRAANETLRRAQEIRQQMEQMFQGQGQAQPQTAGSGQPGTSLPSNEDGRGDWSEYDAMDDAELFDRMARGDKKAGAKVVGYLRSRSQPPTMPQQLQPAPQASTPRAEPSAPAEPDKPVVIGGRVVSDSQLDQIDSMLRADFAEVVEHSPSIQQVRNMFATRMADTGNQYRRPVDIAREVATYVQAKAPKADPRDRLVARQLQKQGMPQAPTATTQTPSSPDEADPGDGMSRNSRYIAEQRKKRGQAPMGPLRRPDITAA